ncbi:uncharacterized serine-rich protein C215.13 [Drosophila erecta]|uniref:Uncharacterized protein n=1 Tax=Drosophila erecta TaxID=7220 RepID=B3N3G2_DROER|nr:uncharacterized serine-rich protein C215.13 [Drosophila erecta]EDV59844.1 uncharacterized protein Dere_GG10835 [Drosophila erecta]
MSKRVSIMLPDEMTVAHSGSRRNPMPSHTVKSSIKSGSSARTPMAPPVFVVVNPESSQSSLTSGQRNNTSTTSNSSLNQRSKEDSGERLSGVADTAALESNTWLQNGSSNSGDAVNFGSTSASIRKFLRSTVALVGTGESLTSVKQLFHKFIKRSGSMSTSKPSLASSCSQTAGEENPYMSKSNDTLLTDVPIRTTVPSTSQMTPTSHFSSYSFNNTNYDLYNLLSDITPLTGYTPVGLTEEADYRSDTSANTALNSMRSLAEREEDPSGGGFGNSSLKISPDPVKAADPQRRPTSRDRSSSRSFRPKLGTSRASLRRKSPKMTPRSNQSVPAVGPIFAMVSSSGPNSAEGSRRSSQSSRSSLRRKQSPLPKVAAKSSATSSSRLNLAKATTSRKESSPRSRSTNRPRKSYRRSSPRRPSRGRGTRTSALESEDTAKVEYAFTLVSPEEAGNSQPEESSAGVEDASSSCQTYQKHCNCHHCQDMRRAVKRADFFKSPEGQKRLQAKLLAKNFFMDLCALSEVRRQVQSNLHGTRRHPSARHSYPVTICGATRLSAGSLSLQWITHDLDSVDHFDVFVDNVPSRSVYNRQATNTVLVDVNPAETHTLRLRAVPERGSRGQDASVEKFMSEVAAGHMRQVRQGQLFARCFAHLDARPQQRSLVDFWTDSEFLYVPTRASLPPPKVR